MSIQAVSGFGVNLSGIDISTIVKSQSIESLLAEHNKTTFTYFEAGAPVILDISQSEQWDFSTYNAPVSQLRLGYRGDSGYTSESGEILSWDEFNSLARSTAEAYTKSVGWEGFTQCSSVNFCEEGLQIITGFAVRSRLTNEIAVDKNTGLSLGDDGPFTSRIVTWDELGIDSYTKNNDGYQVINHPYLGEVKIDGEGADATNAAIHMALAATDAWEAVNGPDPEIPNRFGDMFKYVKSYGAIEKYSFRPEPNSFVFVSTDDVVQDFLRLYDSYNEAKKKDFELLSAFYSVEAILERAQKAGYTDPDELERIVAFQRGKGDNATEGLARLEIDPYGSLEGALIGHLKRNWNSNGLLVAFGWGEVNDSNAYEIEPQYNSFVISLAHAALTGEGQIDMIGFSLSYEQFLDAERRMTNINTSLARCFLSPTPNPSKLLESQRNEAIKLAGELGGVAGQRVMEWFEGREREFIKMVEDYEKELNRPGYFGDLYRGRNIDFIA